ncbi:hypothetical protein [Rheinheimera sp. UJ63]|uniref:hypothetical protein n=1 Tax=Rheinheimera sp. UJ63 TaxID=2910157 RepID=UPI001F401C44|nr:hypothetical protein [Rheinheimera sp. UJ63]MCF4007796.1 hypothetical protein [Rheinheimera sp. UJ63]
MQNKLKRKWLIFTSAGDNSNIQQWLGAERKYDVFVVYYGPTEFLLKNDCEVYKVRKGGKYQNLHYFYNEARDYFNQYEAILVMDDDIEIPTANINALFHLRENRKFDLLQSAFDRRGKISHKITEFNPLASIRITNFIEVTCPVFSQRALVAFLNEYDPTVNATGVDWWFCSIVERNFGLDSIAISDDITCLNPHDLDKNPIGNREIDRLLSREQRNQSWIEVKKKHNLELNEGEYVLYHSEYRPTLKKISYWVFTKIANVLLRIQRKLNRKNLFRIINPIK